MAYARCVLVVVDVATVTVDYHPSARVVLDIHTDAVSGADLRIRLDVHWHHRLCVCLAEQALQNERRAKGAHNLRLARRLGARRDLPSAPGDRRWYMRGVERWRLGEERYFLVVPVNEDLTRRGENVRSAALNERKIFSFEGGKARRDRTDFQEASRAQREHGQKLERRRERGKVVYLHQPFSLSPREDVLNWGEFCVLEVA